MSGGHKKIKLVRTSLKEIPRRTTNVKAGDIDKIYLNGENNLYPNEIDAIINASPTALRASSVMAKYIGGKGIMDADTGVEIPAKDLPIVNSQKNYKIFDVVELIARSISRHNGYYIHVSYRYDVDKGILVRDEIDVLDNASCRKQKDDSEENKGKIIFSDWEKNEVKNRRFYYPYNSNQDVIRAQIEHDAKDSKIDEDDFLKKVQNYRGQVLYVNLTPEYHYGLAPINAAFNEADSESKIVNYTNEQVRNGFQGKTTVLTQGLDEETAEEVDKELQDFLGTEGTGNLYHLSVSETDNIENVMKIITLPAQYNDKLFEYTDKRIEKNILGAFNNIPKELLSASNGALFSAGGEAYIQMKKFYSEQTETERNNVERTLQMLGFNYTLKQLQ